jgi:tRNA modification GTPase
MSKQHTTDTIAAQATPLGLGGIGIIRVSGPMVKSIARTVLNKNIAARIVNFCNFFSGDGKIIDQGLAIYFVSPYSFTGEDVLELQGHGGNIVMDILLQRILGLGARIAQPGEFLKRAFLNRKLNLTQVEAVADLINASSSQAAYNAMRSLQGEFSQRITNLSAQLIGLRVHIEAMIDFAEEESVENATFCKQDLNNILQQINSLKMIARQGMVLREGVTMILIGNTNAGKSSILNYLSGQSVAIVTDIPGTTRDILRVLIRIDGSPVNLLDTAGFHDKPDPIEAEGIRRAWEEIKKADHVLLVVDAVVTKTRNALELSAPFFKKLPEHAKITILYNKIDLTKEKAQIVTEGKISSIYLSVKTKQGLDLLYEHLKTCIGGLVAIEDGFSARRRHLDILDKTEECLKRINSDLVINNIELTAAELREAHHILGEITGEFTSNDLLNKIFSEFCVGK